VLRLVFFPTNQLRLSFLVGNVQTSYIAAARLICFTAVTCGATVIQALWTSPDCGVHRLFILGDAL